jgi:hypothetical protein
MSGGDRSRDDSDQPVRYSNQVPEQYAKLATTPLEVEVKPGQNSYPLQVE